MSQIKLVDPENEYKKNKNITREATKELEEWVKTQPHLPEITEIQAIFFFHSCKYDLEMTKKTIESFFTFRTNNSEIFATDLEENKLKATMNSVAAFPLLEKTSEGYVAVFSKILTPDAQFYDFPSHYKIVEMCSILEMYQLGTFNGFVMIMDLDNITWSHYLKLTPFILKKYLTFLQESYPVRLRGIHLMNTPKYVQTLLNVIKAVMHKSVSDLFFIHDKSLASLYEAVPKSMLPQEYDGQAPSIQSLYEKELKKIRDNFSIIESIQKQKVDDTKREKSNSRPFFRNLFG